MLGNPAVQHGPDFLIGQGGELGVSGDPLEVQSEPPGARDVRDPGAERPVLTSRRRSQLRVRWQVGDVEEHGVLRGASDGNQGDETQGVEP